MIFVFRRNKFLLHTHNQRNCKQFQIQWELGLPLNFKEAPPL